MRQLIAVFAALFPFAASAAPFALGDLPDQTTTHCQLEYDGVWGQDAAVTGTPKVCRFDIAGATVSAHTIRMKAVKVDPIWGRQESVPSAPLTFSPPAPPAATSTPRLTAQ